MRATRHRPEAVEERLADLPPSAKFVYTVLQYNGRMTQQELIEETLLSPRTTRYAITKLEDAELINSRTALQDARQTCYSLASGLGSRTGRYANDVLVDREWVEERREAFRADDSRLRLVQVGDAERRLPGSTRLDPLNLHHVDQRGIPDRGRLESVLGEAGIGTDTRLVLYSANANREAAHAYWTLTYYGHGDCYLLDGGLEAWLEGGYPTVSDDEEPSFSPREYEVTRTIEQVRAYRDDVVHALTQDTAILDVRTPPERRGDVDDEGWTAAQPSGYIPGSVNVPWRDVLQDDGRFKRRGELEMLFEERGIDADTPVIVYCSIGERSALVWFALRELLGYTAVRNYDGSWIEWGNLVDAPVEHEPSGVD